MKIRSVFVEPATPTLKVSPPVGPDWIHEVKFDGFRAQLHADAGCAIVYSRNGHDFTQRFRPIAAAVAKLPVSSAVIDAEIISCGEDGLPDFNALMRRSSGPLCAYCFDLLEFDGRDLRDHPLEKRKAILQAVIDEAANPLLRYSDEFEDPLRLLTAAEELGLEGIVSKRRDGRYVSGPRCGWVKVKTRTWRKANRERYRLFERTGA